MTAPVTPRMLSFLEEMDAKTQQMTCEDFGPLQNLVNTPALTSYDVDLEARTCSCQLWQVTGIPCLHTLTMLREKKPSKEDYCDECFLSENSRLT